MQRILRKRIGRNFKENFFQYITLMLLIVLSMFLIVGIVSAADTVITESQQYHEDYALEDGEFSTFIPLTDEQIKDVEDTGVQVENMFYQDFKVLKGSTLRIYQTRDEINQLSFLEGSEAKADDELVVERRYSEVQKLKVGDKIRVANQEFKIVGIAVTPDYEAPLNNMSDASVDSKTFGVAWVNEDSYQALKKSEKALKAEVFSYSYVKTNNVKDKKIKDSIENLEMFVAADDNPRIGAAKLDQETNKQSGMFAGVIVITLLTYVISVFVTHEIERDQSVIGTLYALGVRKKDLLVHYLFLPVVVSFIAGVIGMCLGFMDPMIKMQLQNCLLYYSLPLMETVHPLYLIVYACVMPSLVAAVVNCIVIYKKLNQPALALIRQESKQRRVSHRKIKTKNFIRMFQTRQFLREMRSSITVLFSMFIACLLLMLGLDIYAMCHNVSVDNKKDVPFEYMYTLKVPYQDLDEKYEKAVAFSGEIADVGTTFDVTILGVDDKDSHFDVNLKDSSKHITISSSIATKFGLEKGDSFEVKEKDENKKHTFVVDDITQYSPSFYIFMDQDACRELFDFEDDFYNVVFADEKVDINSDYVYAITSRQDIIDASGIYLDLMWGMIYMMLGVSALIFVVVMYLMMKVMIERSSQNISLLTIFGYKAKEIRRIYLDGNFLLVAIGMPIILFISKMIIDAIYPYMVTDVASSMNLSMPFYFYIIVYIVVIVLYLLINRVLMVKIKKVTPAVVLKNRE